MRNCGPLETLQHFPLFSYIFAESTAYFPIIFLHFPRLRTAEGPPCGLSSPRRYGGSVAEPIVPALVQRREAEYALPFRLRTGKFVGK